MSEQLTVEQIATELGCAVEDVRALIRDGELKTVACGIRPGLIPRRELDAYRRRALQADRSPVDGSRTRD